MVRKHQPEDRREYTIKIIPHQGETVRSVRVPIRLFKYGLASLAAGAFLFVASASYATYSAFTAADNRLEIRDLQQVNTMQQEQLQQLAKKANALQDQMDELHQIEQELQQISGTMPEDDSIETAHEGQGGPWVKPDVKNVRMTLDNIEQRLEKSRKRLEVIREALARQQEIAAVQYRLSAAVPSIWPAAGDISSPYGMRWGGTDFHPGIDIANDYGTPIYAAADGVVTAAGWNSGGYGNMVDIDHQNGIWTRYGHAQEVVVTIGQTVKKGQVIAYMGSTGFSTGPHVHYEVHVNGEVLNPANYMY